MHATVAALKQLEEPRAVAARRGLDYGPRGSGPPASEARGRGRGRAASRCLMAARLKVTQIKSKVSGEKQNQRDTLRSLGLKRIGDVRRPRRTPGRTAAYVAYRRPPGEGRGD